MSGCRLSTMEVYTRRHQQSSLLSDLRKAGLFTEFTTFLLCCQQCKNPSIFHLVLRHSPLKVLFSGKALSSVSFNMSLLCLHLRPSLKLGDLDTEAGRCMGCLLHSLAEAKNTEPNISPNGRNRERDGRRKQ